MSPREHLDGVALQLVQHLYDQNCRSFCFIGEYAALLDGWSPASNDSSEVLTIEIYVSMSTSLRVWLETHIAPFASSLFTAGPGPGKQRQWLLHGVRLSFIRENPSFYLLSSPPYIVTRPTRPGDLVQEPQLMLAETLRDWQEQLDNALQARLVRFWLGSLAQKGLRFTWRHPGPAAAKIAREFLEEVDEDEADTLREQFAVVGLRLDDRPVERS